MQKLTKRRAVKDIFRQALLEFFVAVVITLVIEFLNQRSFEDLFSFVRQHPMMLLFNVYIVFNTLMFAELWQRRMAWRIVAIGLWIGFGVANYMIISDRILPFTTRDLLAIPDGLRMVTAYFTWAEFILVLVGLAGLLAAMIYPFCRKLKKRRVFSRTVNFTAFALITAVTLIAGKLSVETGIIRWDDVALTHAYKNYGFAYGFTYTFADFGIDRPEQYTDVFQEETLEELLVLEGEPEGEPVYESAAELPGEEEQVLPNIIFVQLESFFDVNELVEAEYSDQPLPNFMRLAEEAASGRMKVPTIGGGTANTEFEILTGMNHDFFAAGEVPYSTVLRSTTCESICYNLKPLGYTSTAIHSYTGNFYGRNHVYANLGFDRFVSQEYMNDLVYTPIGWPKDTALIGEIVQAMESTDEKDFVFTVTVQSHGKFPLEPVEGMDKIELISWPENVDENQLSNFVNELNSVDEFIGGLADRLESFDEPTVVLFYGDHLPGIGLEDANMAGGDVYDVRYIVWNNFGMEFDAPDCEAYRLNAEILRQLGIDEGVITRFHQSAPADSTQPMYLDILRVLEYDMLYGDWVIFEGENPYLRTDIRMGVLPISVSGAEYDLSTGTLTVTGENFTPASDVILNGSRKEAVFMDKNTLLVKAKPDAGDEIAVGQFANDGGELSRTDAIVFEN